MTDECNSEVKAVEVEVSMKDEKDKDVSYLQSIEIEDMTKNCDEVQRKVLAEILSQNADTEYLKRHGLNGCTDPEMFKSKVPLVTYEDIQPDIQSIANGDFSPILSTQPISEFLMSSGTSAGETKLIPTTAEELGRRIQFSALFILVMKQYFPDLDKGKGLYFHFIKKGTRTPGGLIAHPLLTSIFKSHHVRNYDSNAAYTSPLEAILCLDTFQSMYTQILCGLYERHVVFRIGSIFASGLLRAIRFLQVHYIDLCHDISTGTLNPKITDPPLRAHMLAKTMKPDPELASFINHECSRVDKWEGIIRRIWPNAKYLDAIVTGAMAQYIPTLDYYSDCLPKVSMMYASSECYFGLNLNPLCPPPLQVSYTAIPNMGYFEFLPLDHNVVGFTQEADSIPPPLDLADLELGKEYELVVTTYAGLYRYRMGDVLQVTGFHNLTPKFKFVRRKNVILNIDVDKTDESDLQKAIEKASILLQPYNTSIIEYTSCVDIKNIPGHYVFFLELLTKDPMSRPSCYDVMNRCCLAMEEALNSVYRQGRVIGSIGPLEIRVVKNGTFEELMDQAISRGASISQYKVPRCVTITSVLELLNSRVVSTHFSPSLPHSGP